MAANAFCQRIDHQPRAHGGCAKQIRRGHGVVHHVQRALRLAQGANAFQVRDLRAGVGNGLDKHHACVGAQRGSNIGGVGHIHHGHLNAQISQGAQHAVGVAKHKLAGHQVVTRLQQGQKHCADARHAGGEHDGALPPLHLRDLGLQRRRGGRALACVVEAALGRALEHGDQVFDPVIAVLHRGVYGLVDGAVLSAAQAVSVHDLGGEALVLRCRHKNLRCFCGSMCKAGQRTLARPDASAPVELALPDHRVASPEGKGTPHLIRIHIRSIKTVRAELVEVLRGASKGSA